MLQVRIIFLQDHNIESRASTTLISKQKWVEFIKEQSIKNVLYRNEFLYEFTGFNFDRKLKSNLYSIVHFIQNNLFVLTKREYYFSFFNGLTSQKKFHFENHSHCIP